MSKQNKLEGDYTEEEKLLLDLKLAAQQIGTEINVIRQFASQARTELEQLKEVMISDRSFYLLIKDIRDKVEQIHNVTALVEEEEDLTK